MKKIVNRKRYDTETATMIHDWDNGLSRSDFGNCSETLYVTKSGAYFLHGEGGAMSPYSQPCGNNSQCGGSDIVPLTKDEAINWLESHDGTAALEQHFASDVVDA